MGTALLVRECWNVEGNAVAGGANSEMWGCQFVGSAGVDEVGVEPVSTETIAVAFDLNALCLNALKSSTSSRRTVPPSELSAAIRTCVP